MRRITIYTAAAIFALALIVRFRSLGGPYFEIPETIQDHVAPVRFPSRDAIVMSEHAAKVIPRGASVTVIMPSQAPNYDMTLYLVASGLLPHNRIVAPADNAQYIITVREPLNDAAYELRQKFAEGAIYSRR